MAEILQSVGLDVGTTSTQLILSQLTVENRASGFSVPHMEISQRKILYKSPIHFTPLLREDLVDGAGIRAIVNAEYAKAGIRREDIHTGAVIITGETSRKENAATVLESLSDLAGDFVVAFNGVTVTTIDEVYAQRHKLSVGDKVSIRVFRDGEYLDLTMVMMASPD